MLYIKAAILSLAARDNHLKSLKITSCLGLLQAIESISANKAWVLGFYWVFVVVVSFFFKLPKLFKGAV